MPAQVVPSEAFLRPRMREVIVEATSRCNLRCLYCAVSQPGYVGRDLEGDPETILRAIVELGPREVQINGHGETTMLPGWIRLADTLSRSGVPVTLTSNLAREYAPEEIEALARLKVLTVSCDTSDPALYARLRRGGRLEQIEANLRAIRAARSGRRTVIVANCTFSHRVVQGLPDLVRWAKRFDLDAVALTNLELYPGLPGKLLLRHPAQVDPLGAQAAIREARRLARAAGLDLYTMGGLDGDLERAASEVREGRARLVPFDQDEHVPGRSESPPRAEAAAAPAPAGAAHSGVPLALPPPSKPRREVPAGKTRDCTDPWEYAFVHADGGVSLCCWAPSIGNLRDATLSDIVSGTQARAMRTELLEGRPSEACHACLARGLTTPEALRRRVAEVVLPPTPLARTAAVLRRLAKRVRKQRRRLEALVRLVRGPEPSDQDRAGARMPRGS